MMDPIDEDEREQYQWKRQLSFQDQSHSQTAQEGKMGAGLTRQVADFSMHYINGGP